MYPCRSFPGVEMVSDGEGCGYFWLNPAMCRTSGFKSYVPAFACSRNFNEMSRMVKMRGTSTRASEAMSADGRMMAKPNRNCIWRCGRETKNISHICDLCWADREAIYQAHKARRAAATNKQPPPNHQPHPQKPT